MAYPSSRLKHTGAVCLLGLGTVALSAQAGGALSEEDYFSSPPVVLTVSRLDQPLSDTPGAVTVLDRDTIRRSGARDVTDLLRLVPGYLVSGWNGANPSAAYHAPLDDFGTRNLVMVDGRSLYSPFYLGDTHRGLMSVLIEDIERIEVLRGSNSAAYGANAMFGVINIITRHTADTLGGDVSVTLGSGDIQDSRARIGWGDPASATFRLSAAQRRDSGYQDAYDDRKLNQFHWRADWRPIPSDDVLLEAGLTEVDAGEGRAGNAGNPLRTVHWRNGYVHGQWRRQLSESEEVKLTANYDEEDTRDVAPYGLLPAILLDFSGVGKRLNLEFQHQRALGDSVRAVWGLGYKEESAQSKPMYARDGAVVSRETRAFGNIEWRMTDKWLANAGLFVGNHNWTGTYSAPRLMLNYHLQPDHTLRAGMTRSSRAPGLFELAGNVRYHLGSQWVGQTFAARGQVQPETLSSREIGYFGNFRDWRLTLDVRAYHERMSDLIVPLSYRLSAIPSPVWYTGANVDDFTNVPGVTSRGMEYQLRWSPRVGTEIWWNQNLERYSWDNSMVSKRVAPSHLSTLALFQKLPGNIDMTLMIQSRGSMAWRDERDIIPSTRRVDLRVAYPFKLGDNRAEASLTVQSLNGDQVEFLSAGRYLFERRTFATLRMEF